MSKTRRSRSRSRSNSKTRKSSHDKRVEKVMELPDDIQIEIMSHLKPTKVTVLKTKIKKIIHQELDASSRVKRIVGSMFEVNEKSGDYKSYMNEMEKTYKYYNNKHDIKAYYDINGRNFRTVYEIVMLLLKYCNFRNE